MSGIKEDFRGGGLGFKIEAGVAGIDDDGGNGAAAELEPVEEEAEPGDVSCPSGFQFGGWTVRPSADDLGLEDRGCGRV